MLKGVTVTLEVEEFRNPERNWGRNQWDLVVSVCNLLWARATFQRTFSSRLTGRTGLKCPREEGRVEREVAFMLENIIWMGRDPYGEI